MKGDFSRQTFDPSKHYSAVLMQQGRVLLDADWNEQQLINLHRCETEAVDVVGASGAPVQGGGFEIDPIDDGADLQISAGRIYVNGILCELELPMTFNTQPDFFELLPGDPTNGGEHRLLIYLEVWQRHLTAIEDPRIKERALGGPDTTTRLKTVWQVRMLQVDAGATCDNLGEDWPPPVLGASLLQVSVPPEAGADRLCLLSAAGGYRGLENQLYRVEVHRGGSLSGAPERRATFKWSRDNGALATAVEEISGQTITVENVGRDEMQRFAIGQWVELLDDRMELHDHHGLLLQIEAVDLDGREITLRDETEIPAIENPRKLKLRRWDQVGDATDAVEGVPLHEGLAVKAGEIELEHGIRLQFSEADPVKDDPLGHGEQAFLPGNYWLFPARTAINGNGGAIEWPQDGEGSPLALLPRGIHHTLPLAILEIDGSGLARTEDCRPTFPALVNLSSLYDPSMHVLEVRAAPSSEDIVVQHNQDLSVDILSKGIGVSCSEAPHGDSVNATTCFVTVDLPYPLSDREQTFWTGGAQPPIGTQPLILNADVTVQDHQIVWMPTPDTATWLRSSLLRKVKAVTPFRSLLAHLTLKGNHIWAANDSNEFLDGSAFGMPGADDAPASVHLPSGNNLRGGDFHIWFQLIEPPPLTLTLRPARITGTKTSQGTITLPDPAAQNTVFDLSSDKPAVVSFESSPVIVPAGETSVDFVVETKATPVPAPVVIKADSGTQAQTAELSVQPFLKVEEVAALVLRGSSEVRLPIASPQDVLAIVRGQNPIAIEVTFNLRPTNLSPKNVDVFDMTRRKKVDLPFRLIKGDPPKLRFDLWRAVPRVPRGPVVIDRPPLGSDIVSPVFRGDASPIVGGTPRSTGIEDRTTLLPELPGLPLEFVLSNGHYRVTLLGTGRDALLSPEGTRMDGQPAGFPSGNDAEGGNFKFSFRVSG